MQTAHDLNLILQSRVPLVVVETPDEARFLQCLQRLLADAGAAAYRPLFRWAVTQGLQRVDIELAAQPTTAAPDQVLGHMRSVTAPGIYVLLDFHPYLEDPVHVRLLKDIALAAEGARKTVILVSHALQLPAELEAFAARFEMSLPSAQERAAIVAEVIGQWNAEHPGSATVDATARELLERNLAGLTRSDSERLARGAIFDDGALTACDIPEVTRAKYALLNRDGVLTYEQDTARFSEVGGLRRLRVWLEQRRRVLLEPAAGTPLDPPRGLLLMGVQGCGKSLAAKAAAGVLGLPLLRLDIGALYNKFHGETDRNLRDSLRQAELMAPCVLWIDELEKALATDAGNDGLSKRILGAFLTWLAEKSTPVFVVATANDITRLPPELVRKGRFDEIFFVDLPTPEVRLEILRIHLQRREQNPQEFALVDLVTATDGFSGAEIEQGIVSALYAAHAVRRPLTDAQLLDEFRRTRPLSVLMAEQLAALRSWASARTVPAD